MPYCVTQQSSIEGREIYCVKLNLEQIPARLQPLVQTMLRAGLGLSNPACLSCEHLQNHPAQSIVSISFTCQLSCLSLYLQLQQLEALAQPNSNIMPRPSPLGLNPTTETEANLLLFCEYIQAQYPPDPAMIEPLCNLAIYYQKQPRYLKFIWERVVYITMQSDLYGLELIDILLDLAEVHASLSDHETQKKTYCGYGKFKNVTLQAILLKR